MNRQQIESIAAQRAQDMIFGDRNITIHNISGHDLINEAQGFTTEELRQNYQEVRISRTEEVNEAFTIFSYNPPPGPQAGGHRVIAGVQRLGEGAIDDATLSTAEMFAIREALDQRGESLNPPNPETNR